MAPILVRGIADLARWARVSGPRAVGYFFLGLGWDALVCIDLIATAHGLWVIAGVTSFILAATGFEVYNKLIRENLDRVGIYALSLGSAVGTAVIVRYFEVY